MYSVTVGCIEGWKQRGPSTLTAGHMNYKKSKMQMTALIYFKIPRFVVPLAEA